jgi:ribosome-associated translation inhibitor RaiA
MKVSIRYKNVETPTPVEKVVETHVLKIEKLLQHYDPDLVQIHGSFEKHPQHDEYICSVDLSLPTGKLCASAPGPDPRVSARKAFVEILGQIKKHQSLLRKDHEWKRKRVRVDRVLA